MFVESFPAGDMTQPGRVAMRAAIVNYLTAANLPFVGEVLGTAPKITSENTFFVSVPAGTGTGAVIFVHLERQRETLLSYPAVGGGWKERPFDVVLMCFLRSVERRTDAIQLANDQMLDALVHALEMDPNMGDTAVVYTQGLGRPPRYGPDIEVESDLPRPVLQGATEIFTTVRFVASEMVQAV